MNVEIKFICRDLVGDLRDGLYEMPEAATVETAIDVACAEAGKELSPKVREHIVFLVNSKPARWESVLKEGDKLHILYKILGG